RLEGPAFALDLPARLPANTRHNRLLVDVQPGNTIVNRFHRFPLHCAAGVGTSFKTNSNKRAPRTLLPLGSSGGAPRSPGPTRNRALPHQGKTDLTADGCAILPQPRSPASFIQGGSVAADRWPTRNDKGAAIPVGVNTL